MIKLTELQLRKIIRQEILREGEGKDAADVEKLKAKIEAMSSSLKGAFKSIDNPVEIAQALSFLIDKIVGTGGVEKSEVMKALTSTMSSKKKEPEQK